MAKTNPKKKATQKVARSRIMSSPGWAAELRGKRAASGLSLRLLSEKVGITKSKLHYLEHGTAEPLASELLVLGRVLGMSVEWETEPRGAQGGRVVSDYLVTVCAECRTASCWHGEFMCQQSKWADTEHLPASLLDQENREHPSNYSREAIIKVTGREPREVAA